MVDIYATALDADAANRGDITAENSSTLSWQGNGLVLNVSIRNTAKTQSQTVKIAGSIDYFAGLGVGASGRTLGANTEGKFLQRLCGLAASTRAILAGQSSGHLANSTLAGLVPYFGARFPPAIPSWSNSVGLNSPYPMQDEVGKGTLVPVCVCMCLCACAGVCEDGHCNEATHTPRFSRGLATSCALIQYHYPLNHFVKTNHLLTRIQPIITHTCTHMSVGPGSCVSAAHLRASIAGARRRGCPRGGWP